MKYRYAKFIARATYNLQVNTSDCGKKSIPTTQIYLAYYSQLPRIKKQKTDPYEIGFLFLAR